MILSHSSSIPELGARGADVNNQYSLLKAVTIRRTSCSDSTSTFSASGLRSSNLAWNGHRIWGWATPRAELNELNEESPLPAVLLDRHVPLTQSTCCKHAALNLDSLAWRAPLTSGGPPLEKAVGEIRFN